MSSHANLSRSAAALVGAGALLGLTGQSTPVAAQAAAATLMVDVVIINDDGGTATNGDLQITYRRPDGSAALGTDLDPAVCATPSSGVCFVASIPPGAGFIGTVGLAPYDRTMSCTTSSQNSIASGISWDVQPGAVVHCVFTADDVAPAPTTTTTTTVPTTTVPDTTMPDTTAPATTVPDATTPETTEAPGTTQPTTTPVPTTATPLPAAAPAPAPRPSPATELPSTGSPERALTITALLLVALGGAAVRVARRPA